MQKELKEKRQKHASKQVAVNYLFNKLSIFYQTKWLPAVDPMYYGDVQDMWVESLDDVTEAQIKIAGEKIVKGYSAHNDFPPSPGEFAALARTFKPDEAFVTFEDKQEEQKSYQQLTCAMHHMDLIKKNLLSVHDSRGRTNDGMRRLISAVGKKTASLLPEAEARVKNG